MYKQILKFLILISLLFPVLEMNAQGTGNNPYSRIGLGDFIGQYGNVRNMGMGGVGVSTRSAHHTHFLNPALMANLKKIYNDSTIKLDFGFNPQIRILQSKNSEEMSFGFNFTHIVLQVPVSKRWSSAVGLMPFTSVDYNQNYSQPVTNDPAVTANYAISGKGSVYKLFLSNGYSISKYLSAGLETSYLFGNINRISLINIPDFDPTNEIGFKTTDNVSTFHLKPALALRLPLFKQNKDSVLVKDSLGQMMKIARSYKSLSGLFLNFGVTYDYFVGMDLEQKKGNYILSTSNFVSYDSVFSTTKYKTQIPSIIRFGASIEKLYRWTLGADFYFSDWSSYALINTQDTLRAAWGVMVGGEFTPGNLNFKRTPTYRLGFNYQNTPYFMQNISITDYAFTLGASLPVGKLTQEQKRISQVLPKINVALVYGRRGTTENGLLLEHYIKMQLSLLINEKWFNKRKIE